MKKLFITFLIAFSSISLFSQVFLDINFEDNSDLEKIEIDSTFSNNKWQVGKPSKIIFDSSRTLYHAIVTDTINILPPSDTSVFILKQFNPFSFPVPSYVMASMQFYYKMNKKPNDIVKIEMSVDTGHHWINMLEEDTTYDIQWYGNKPNFNDTNDIWKQFHANYSQWFSTGYTGVNSYPIFADADTFQFRFTFITDSLSTNSEGWMIDDIFCSFLTPESNSSIISNQKSVLFYPNPITNSINLKRFNAFLSKEEKIEIYTIDGRKVYEKNITGELNLKVELPKGNYILRYLNGNNIQTEKVIVE